jgi:hypothetical protein
MADVCVYYFMRHGAPGDKAVLSQRRATLETIKYRGDAVLQSRRIVDHSEVDDNGFLIGGASDKSHPELWPEIRSLELRAKSRDDEVLKIEGSTASARKQRLQRESLELSSLARILRARAEAEKQRNRYRTPGAGYWPPRPQAV